MALVKRQPQIEVREIPLPHEVRREVEDGYELVEDAAGVVWIETQCDGTCKQLYRIDTNNTLYGEVLRALEHGDRSIIDCYHRPLN